MKHRLLIEAFLEGRKNLNSLSISKSGLVVPNKTQMETRVEEGMYIYRPSYQFISIHLGTNLLLDINMVDLDMKIYSPVIFNIINSYTEKSMLFFRPSENLRKMTDTDLKNIVVKSIKNYFQIYSQEVEIQLDELYMACKYRGKFGIYKNTYKEELNLRFPPIK